MRASAAILFHFAVSVAWNSLSPSGVLASGSIPAVSNRSDTSLSERVAELSVEFVDDRFRRFRWRVGPEPGG